MDNNVRFIRKDGRIIPIAAAAAGAGAVAVSHKAKLAKGIVKGARVANAVAHTGFKKQPKPSFEVNQKLDMAGLGLSLASGAFAAATFSGGAKGLAAGFFGSHALDALGIGANVASVAGHGKTKERAKIAAKHEARNFIAGNAVYAAGLLGIKKNRQALVGYASKVISFARTALRVAV